MFDISTRERRETLISITFLDLSPPFWGQKTSKCEHSKKPSKSRSGSTNNARCLIHLVSRSCFSLKEKSTSQLAGLGLYRFTWMFNKMAGRK